MKNKGKTVKKKISFRIVLITLFFLILALCVKNSILMGKEINITQDISTGIMHENEIYFLCNYELREPGWYIFVIFVPGKLHYKDINLYSFNIKTGKLTKISKIDTEFNKSFIKWEREGTSIFFTTQEGWDKKNKEHSLHIFEYNTKTADIKKYDKDESEKIYNKLFAGKTSLQGKDKLKISEISYYTGVLPQEAWALPDAADYSGMSKNEFKKLIVELEGNKTFRESVYSKIKDDLSSDELFKMISSMEKIHNSRKGYTKTKFEDLFTEWKSRLYIEAQYKEGNKQINIHKAAYKHNREQLVQLLTSGIDPDTRDSEGLTPLMVAAYVNDPEIIDLLLSKGANINAYDNKGCTALVYAVFGKAHLSIETLFKKGATRSVDDKKASYAWIFVANTPLKNWYLEHETKK